MAANSLWDVSLSIDELGLDAQLLMMRRTIPLLSLLLAPQLAAAEPVRATYELSWNGIEVATAESELSRDPGGYKLVWRGETSGFLGLVYPFTSEAMSEGIRHGGGLTPVLHTGQSLRQEETNAWTVTFDASGRAVRVEIPEDDRLERDPVPAELQVGPDPLSLALLALDRVGPGVRQTGTAFDGRRVIRLDAACADAPEPLADIGPALLCTVEGELVAGASRRWRERDQPREERPPARVWLTRGELTDGWWPVLVEATTRWGTVTARLIPGASSPPAG